MTGEIIKFPSSGDNNKNLFTTKQLAEQLKTSPKVIISNAKKCLPNKSIKNGKTTHFTEAEVTVMLDYMKKNPKLEDRGETTFTCDVKVTTTALSPILRLKQISDEKEKLYNEEIEIYKNELKEEQEAHEKTKNMYEQTKKELTYQTLSKEKYQDLVWIEANRSKELEGYLDKRTDKQKHRAKYVYMQD
jgi:hypothetical protein